MDVKEETILGERIGSHWYYKSKADALLHLLRDTDFSEILDVGAGSGFFSKIMLEKTRAQRACCVDINYPSQYDDVVAGKPLVFRSSCEKTSADLVLLMDVLEHVDDDVQLLSTYVDKAPSGAYFAITVPAFPFLWSSHDVFLEHKRRYTKESLIRVVERSGLVVDTCCYFFGLVFPLALLRGWAAVCSNPTRAR
jgi:predicted TPR repeat methyltransferase